MIILENVSKKFNAGKREIQVLTDISFKVQKGESLAVKGRSGSGKTTLLHCMAGIEKPDEGKIVCLSQNISSLSPGKISSFLRVNTGFVFQQGNLLSYLTVYENIAFPLRLNRVYGKKIEKRVACILEKIDMPNAAKVLPKELSGGESMRVAVARALVHHPKIVFADEPTASLDSKTARIILELLTAISKEQKCSIIFSTHDAEVLNMADRVLELKDGEII